MRWWCSTLDPRYLIRTVSRILWQNIRLQVQPQLVALISFQWSALIKSCAVVLFSGQEINPHVYIDDYRVHIEKKLNYDLLLCWRIRSRTQWIHFTLLFVTGLVNVMLVWAGSYWCRVVLCNYLNESKIKCIMFGTSAMLSDFVSYFGTSASYFKSAVRNLGVMLDRCLKCDQQTDFVLKTSFSSFAFQQRLGPSSPGMI